MKSFKIYFERSEFSCCYWSFSWHGNSESLKSISMTIALKTWHSLSLTWDSVQKSDRMHDGWSCLSTWLEVDSPQKHTSAYTHKKTLTNKGSSTLNVSNTTLWGRVVGWIKRKKVNDSIHLSLLPDCRCNAVRCLMILLPCFPCCDGLYPLKLQTKINSSSILFSISSKQWE